MEELFITKIHIHEVRHLKDFDIPLSETERKHLILTGRNGSGKTSVLEALLASLKMLQQFDASFQEFGRLDNLRSKLKASDDPKSPRHLAYVRQIDGLNMVFPDFLGVEFETSSGLEPVFKALLSNQFLLSYFKSRRKPEFETPTVIEKVTNFKGSQFLKYLLNITADRAFAIEEKDEDAAQRTDEWLENFRNSLRDLFGDPKLEFEFNRKDYHYYLKQEGKNAAHFNQLPDGYASIIEILTELVMKLEETKAKAHEVQGIVIIDEIETHLHIDLQKKILPFLTSFFPKIQFIVTTHSPFVLNSVDNAVICDLEKRIVTTDLSGYSSEIIVESYFGTDKYSQILKDQVDEYEKLMGQETLSFEDEDRLDELESYFETIPKYLSDELTVKLQQIRLKNLKLQN